MNRRLRAVSLLALVLAIVVGAQRYGAPQAHASAQTGGAIWSIVPSPSVGAVSQLTAVSADSASDAWAVGDSFNGQTSRTSNLIEHWSGSVWRVVPSPSPGTDDELNGVAALSPTDVWVVGFQNSSSWAANRTLIEHWNGGSWQIVPSPNPSSGANDLWDVAAVSRTEVWAVGEFSSGPSGGVSRTLVERWDGTQWSVASSPDVSSLDFLNRAAADPAGDVWAAGASYGPNSKQPLLTERFTGTNWSVVPSPTLANADYPRGVAADKANDGWLVGQANGPEPTYTPHTLVEHWNGSSWRIVATQDSAALTLTGVAALSPTDAWIVGDNASRTLVEHWNGTGWQAVQSPNKTTAPSANNYLNAVTALPHGTLWAVGSYDTSNGHATMILKATGG